MLVEASDIIDILRGPAAPIMLVHFHQPTAIARFLAALQEVVIPALNGKSIAVVDVEGLGEAQVVSAIETALASERSRDVVLVIIGINMHVAFIAGMLNGVREKLANLSGCILVLERSLQREFLVHCPDLAEWIGLNVVRAEAISCPFGLKEIVDSIHALESKYAITSEQFQARARKGPVDDFPDAWYWSQLLFLRDKLGESAI